MGSPLKPTAEQLDQLKAAAANTSLRSDVKVEVQNNVATFTTTLPRQGVSLIELKWTPSAQ